MHIVRLVSITALVAAAGLNIACSPRDNAGTGAGSGTGSPGAGTTTTPPPSTTTMPPTADTTPSPAMPPASAASQ